MAAAYALVYARWRIQQGTMTLNEIATELMPVQVN